MTDQHQTQQQVLRDIQPLRCDPEQSKSSRVHDEALEQLADALRASEERYRRLASAVTDYIYTVYLENGVPVKTIHSEACAAVTGYTAGDFAGDRYLWITMVPDEDRGTVQNFFRDVTTGRPGPQAIEHRIISKDGAVRWVSNTLVLHHDNHGALVAYDGLVKDITDRKKTEEALYALIRGSSAVGKPFFESILLELVRALRVRYALIGRMLFAPAQRLRTLAFIEDETVAQPFEYDLAGTPCEQVVGETIRYYPRDVWKTFPRPRLLREKGIESYMGIPLFSSAREPLGLIAVMHDRPLAEAGLANFLLPIFASRIAAEIERLQMEQVLHASEERFRAIVETTSDAILTVDADMQIMYWNNAAEKLFGYDATEAIGRTVYFLVPPDKGLMNERAVQELLEGRTAPLTGTIFDTVVLRKDGSELPVELSLSQWDIGGQQFFSAFVRDISARKRLQEEASHAARLASIGELAAGVAHEINNPVNGIINYAQLLLDECQKQGGDPEFPREIINEGRRIAAIVKNLLTFARETRDQAMPFELFKIFEAAFMLFAKQFEKNFIFTRVDITHDLPPVLVRPQQVQQVFVNILSNARYALNIKYPDFHAEKKLEVSGRQVLHEERRYVRVLFHDRGIGISKDMLPRVCDPFFSGRPRGEGMGLGLTICHNIITAHGGQLRLESEEGAYTNVIVDLPVHDDEK